MKVGISRFVVVGAMAALMVLAGGTTARAQVAVPPCTVASPNFKTDFTSNQNCLVPNESGLPGYPGFFSPATPFGSVNPAQPQPAGVNTVLRLTTNSQFQSASAWFNAPQPVAGSFSSTFKFQLSNSSNYIADGFAFVIQNSPAGTTALKIDDGSDGCSLGFGAATNGTCTSSSGGITNSLAVAFDTYQNPEIGDISSNHVEIQSCGMGANTVDSSCRLAGADVDLTGLAITVADGFVHTVTISFTPAAGCNNGTCPGILDVIVDNHDLFPPTPNNQSGGVAFDIASLGLTNGTAYVGFTGATGGGTDVHDILSWTFAPLAQSAPVSTNTQAVVGFNGGTNSNAYDYNALLTAGGVTTATVTIKPILISENACEKLVNANKAFGNAQCFDYQNAGKDSAGNLVDSAVMFELTCPDQTGGTCGNPTAQNFFATLGSDFTFTKAENPGFQLLNSTIGPYPGWLKGTGPDPLHPCTPFQNNNPALFQSNQIVAFSVVGDPSGKTVGRSGGGGSCWVATYFTSGEVPPGVKINAPTLTTYKQSTTPGSASYTCSDPKTSKPASSPTGPYLTAASCQQNQAPNLNNNSSCSANVGGVITCTGKYDLSVKGLHVFTVTSKDSGGNVGANAVIYNVK